MLNGRKYFNMKTERKQYYAQSIQAEKRYIFSWDFVCQYFTINTFKHFLMQKNSEVEIRLTLNCKTVTTICVICRECHMKTMWEHYKHISNFKR